MCSERRDKSLVSIGNTHDNATEKEKLQIFTYYNLLHLNFDSETWNDNIRYRFQLPHVRSQDNSHSNPKAKSCGVGSAPYDRWALLS